MRHDIESCDKGGEDQDKTWLDGLVDHVGACVASTLEMEWNAQVKGIT